MTQLFIHPLSGPWAPRGNLVQGTARSGWHLSQTTLAPVERDCWRGQRGGCSADGAGQGMQETGTPGLCPPGICQSPAGAHGTASSTVTSAAGEKQGRRTRRSGKPGLVWGAGRPPGGGGISRMRQQLTRGKGGWGKVRQVEETAWTKALHG